MFQVEARILNMLPFNVLACLGIRQSEKQKKKKKKMMMMMTTTMMMMMKVGNPRCILIQKRHSCHKRPMDIRVHPVSAPRESKLDVALQEISATKASSLGWGQNIEGRSSKMRSN